MKINMKIENKDIKRVVPPLRFPEFRDTEGWEVTTLKSICKITNGKCNAQDHIEGGIYPLFDRSETRKASNSYLFDCEAVIIPGEGMRFTPKYYIGKFNLHQRAYALKDFSCIGLYIYYLMEHRSDLLSINAVKSTVLSLRLPILQDFPIETPKNLREQKKIADCLSSLDDLINAVTDKIETLKEYKKGLMQQLFPAEGKTIPALRFPEFQNAGEWKQTTLGDIGKIMTGNTPSTKDFENYGGDKLFVSPIDISDKRYVSKTKKTLTSKGFSLSRRVKKNSILFVCIGSTIGKVAQNKIECATNQQINSVTPFNGYVADFIYSVLEYYAAKIASIAGKQAVPIINKTLFASVSISIPSEGEQRIIADYLLSIDELISVQTDKLDQLKAHKKGLMQQLFPELR